MENFITNMIDLSLASGEIDRVHTRFPPEPNGYLHIGHAKSICLNFGIAKQYKGTCNLRFDDTNPTKEDVEYVDAIMEDIKWLGFNWDSLHYASDYFDQLFEYAVKLIDCGKAYVCDLSAEEMKIYRGTLTEKGKDSPYRNRSIAENLDLFEKMRAGQYKEGEKVLRAKIDMSSPNLNMRDPVIYRILFADHHRTGSKWCVYPMYDFTHPISDTLEGITNSICTMEFEDHRPLYDWVLEACGFEKPSHQIEFARLNITNTIMSKRFLKMLVEQGKVSGWDDPRMPTLCGIRRRGYPAEAVKNFCESVGVAKANSEVDFAMLEFACRDYLNTNAERAMAVRNPVKLVITNFEAVEAVDFEINPHDLDHAVRKIDFTKEIYIDGDDFSETPQPKYFRLKPDGYVRLKGAYIIHCESIIKNVDGTIDHVECSIVPHSHSGNDTSGVKAKGVLQWVSAETGIPSEFKIYQSLLDPNKPEGNFIDRLNENSLEVLHGFVEPYVASSALKSRFQFIRQGYYIKDAQNSYIEIVGLKDSFKKI